MIDKIEATAGSPVGIVAFLLWCICMPMVNVDVANYGISVYTAALLVLTIGSTRRDRKAMHAKLDDLEVAVDAADNDLVRLEDKTEEEIELARDRRDI